MCFSGGYIAMRPSSGGVALSSPWEAACVLACQPARFSRHAKS